MINRRNFLGGTLMGSLLGSMTVLPQVVSAKTPVDVLTCDDSVTDGFTRQAPDTLKVSAFGLHVVKVNHRGNWVFIEVKTNKGITGVGEASHGTVGSTSQGLQDINKEIEYFFSLTKGESPFSIEQYRQRGWQRARTGRLQHTVFSAIEQALWDINGKALSVPVYQLFGGKIRDKIRTYANINRATNERDTNGRRPATAFQRNAELAISQGFTAIKMAPFDEMKALPSDEKQIREDIDHAIGCLEAVRKTVGQSIDLMVDVHSHLDQQLGIEVAKRVEPLELYWFEEPVNPEKYVSEMKAISDSTPRTTAGGESVFGREGFDAIIQSKAVDIIMPDVKHCGGMQELRYISAAADTRGLHVAPHNPSGPIATAASVQVVAGIPNFAILEMAFGEVPWRSEIITPAEQFVNGYITVTDRPGLGHELNLREIARHI